MPRLRQHRLLLTPQVRTITRDAEATPRMHYLVGATMVLPSNNLIHPPSRTETTRHCGQDWLNLSPAALSVLFKPKAEVNIVKET